jgi:L,D-transpeptidase catalytic domain
MNRSLNVQQMAWGIKRVAPLLLIVASLAGTQAFAEHVIFQPLTRSDCEKANLTWDDNANVCDGEVEAKRASDVTAVSTGQPLTRRGCGLGGMHWNDNANVCDVALEGETTQSEAKAITAAPTAITILITIDKAAQKMTVSLDGEEQYRWPVSTGLPRYSTPSGAFTARSMNKIWYSKEWDNAPMPHAIFFTREGHAIHGTNELRRLGKPASHGCVRLSPQNAATLYTLVADNGLQNTQVVLTGLTPGRGAYAASSSAQKSKNSGAATRNSRAANASTRGDKAAGSLQYKPQYSFAPGDNSDARSKKRSGGLLKRLFGRR